MKRYFNILASLLVLAGCSDKLNVAEDRPVPDGEMAVNLTVDGPMAGPGTRSYVNGRETAISSIKMICFDAEGAFLTARDGAVSATNATHGTLRGTVPANTARIHFVANFDGLDLSSFSMGVLERVMMKSAALSSDIDDDVRFWGYHRESNPSAMAGYLLGGNKVVLLRDRAKVTVTNGDADIKSLQWTVSNGLKKGFVAAASSSDNGNPFDNEYVNATILTEYRSSGVYTLTDEASIWTGPGAENPQFLFENANSTEPVKIIVKAVYTDGTTRYHTILLQDENKKPYRIYRNQSFVLNVKDLPSKAQTAAIGSDTFEEAVATTNYSNNPFVQVAREVDEVNDDKYRLTVESVDKIFNQGTTGTVSFTFTGHDGGSVAGFKAGDFEASWEPKDDTDERPDVSPVTITPTISYDANTGEGSISFPLSAITSELKFNSLRLVSPSGLTRYVDVYSISQFEFASAPVLVDNGTKRTVGDYQRETYKLTFGLPSNLIPAMFPLTVKMYTGTLAPFSDSAANTQHGSFNIAVGPTASLDATDQAAQWNYNANKWDYWYEYVINEPDADGNYTIYLNSFVEELFPERPVSTVGLYFEIEHFGGRTALSAAAPQPTSKTVSYSASNFSFSGHTANSTKNGVTVRLSDSDKSGSNLVLGYTSGWISTTYHNGSITVNCQDNEVITGIELTYRSGYLGGAVTASTGSFAKSGTTGTWTGNASEVKLTLARNGNDFAQITAIKVTKKSF